jgi:hypothetical protein
MNPNLCRVALRPRSPLEVADLACAMVRDNWRPYLRLAATLLVVPALACGAIGWFAPWAGPWLLAATLLAGPLLEAPFTTMSGRLLFEPQVAVTAVLRDTIARSPALLLLTVLRGTLGFVPLIADAALLFVAEAALLERGSVTRSLQRSLSLAAAQPSPAMFGALSWYVLVGWCGLVGEYGGQTLVRDVLQLGEPFGTAWSGAVTPYLVCGVMAARPLHAIYRLLLYVDARTRGEGWDLQVGLRAAGMS